MKKDSNWMRRVRPRATGPGLSRRRAPLVAALMIALASGLVACEEGLVGTDDDVLAISALEITAADTALAEGATSHYEAQAKNEAGVTIDTVTITWSTGDESVATVGANTGTVTAVMDGETYIVARTGSGDAVFTDSVPVTVSMPEVTTVGHAEVRVRGDIIEGHSFTGDSAEAVLVAEESLGPAGNDVTWLEAWDETNSDEVGLFGVFPQTTEFSTGTIDLASWDPTTLESETDFVNQLSGPIALFYKEGDGYDTFYANTEGTITIESIEGQAGYGSGAAATLNARVVMTALVYRWDWETDEIAATGETVEVRARMALAYFKDQEGYATLTLTTDSTIQTEASYANAYPHYNGVQVDAGAYHYLTETRYMGLWLGTYLEGQGTGTFALDSIGLWNSPDHGNFTNGNHYVYDDATESYEFDWDLSSESGSVTIDRFNDAPMPDGIIEGTTTVTVNVWDNDTGTFVRDAQAEVSFIVPYDSSDLYWSAAMQEVEPESRLRTLVRAIRVPETLPDVH